MSLIDGTYILNIIIFIILGIILIYLLKLNKLIKIDKRIGKYSIASISTQNHTISDRLYVFYKLIIVNISKYIKKIKLLDNYSLKYKKYIKLNEEKEPIDFVSNKIFFGIVFATIITILNLLNFQRLHFFDSTLMFLVGLVSTDFYYKYKFYRNKKRIKKDILSAVSIMNNAFKSGRSTIQALDIVVFEMDGPISDEFEKMYTEISYGLSFDVVFNRFYERIGSEEIKYIASSLVIANKTGGNIIKVFESIENFLINKNKLDLELNALTASSNAMVKLLIFLPIVFTILIKILNPKYFDILLNTSLGNFFLLIIIVMYFLYVFIVSKVIKVKV